MTFDTLENARKGHRNLATEFADVMWSCHFSSGVVCQILPTFAKTKCKIWQDVPGQVWHWTSSVTKCTSLGQKNSGRLSLA